MLLALQNVPHLSRKWPFFRWLTPFRVAVVALLLTFIPGYFWGRHLEQERRFARWLREEKVLVALQREVFVGQPMPRQSKLGVELHSLSRQTRVPIVLEAGSKRFGFDADADVDLDEKILGDFEQPLDAALVRVLENTSGKRPQDLTVIPSGGKLVVQHRTRPTDPQPYFFQRVYTIPAIQPEGAIRDESAFVEVVKRTIDPYSWDDVEGPANILTVPGGVLVRHSSEVHAKIKRLLTCLAALESSPQDTQPVALIPQEPTPADQRILTALEQVADFSYPETPLTGVVEDLSRRFQIPIYVVRKELEVVAINVETPVTLLMPHTSLRAFLQTICHDLGLAFAIRGGCLQIASDETDSCYQLKLYPVHDLLGEESGAEMATLREAFLRCVHPDSWSNEIGDGEILPVATGWFLVRQSDEVHAEIVALLEKLRENILHVPSSVRVATRHQLVREKILRSLEENFSPEDGVPSLKEFCESVESVISSRVLLDTKRLEEAAVNLETPVNTHPEIQPLGRQLRATLQEAGVAYVLRDEALLVTTREYRHFDLRVFDVRELIAPGTGLMSERELLSLVASVVSPADWEANDGPGFLYLYHGRVIAGSYEYNLNDVGSLLTYLREHRERLLRPEELRGAKSFTQRNTVENRWEQGYLRFATETIEWKPAKSLNPIPTRLRRRLSGGGGYF